MAAKPLARAARALKATLLNRRSWAIWLTGWLVLGCAVVVAPEPSFPTPPPGRWWAVPGVTTCGPPAKIWARGAVVSLGSCSGQLSSSNATRIALAVGESIAVHFWDTTAQFSPPKPDRAVADLVGLTDDGTTAIYRGVAPGATLLSLTAFCNDADGTDLRPCPLVELIVQD